MCLLNLTFILGSFVVCLCCWEMLWGVLQIKRGILRWLWTWLLKFWMCVGKGFQSATELVCHKEKWRWPCHPIKRRWVKINAIYDFIRWDVINSIHEVNAECFSYETTLNSVQLWQEINCSSRHKPCHQCLFWFSRVRLFYYDVHVASK